MMDERLLCARAGREGLLRRTTGNRKFRPHTIGGPDRLQQQASLSRRSRSLAAWWTIASVKLWITPAYSRGNRAGAGTAENRRVCGAQLVVQG
jgi:hypothetical protein